MKKKCIWNLWSFGRCFCNHRSADPNFLSAYNMQNTVKWSSLYGIMSIGVAFVIITGGIDLSIGSVVGLVAVVLFLSLPKFKALIRSWLLV